VTRQEIGEQLDRDRKLWSSVQLGAYVLMQQRYCTLLVKGETIVWSENLPVPRDADQRQPNFD